MSRHTGHTIIIMVIIKWCCVKESIVEKRCPIIDRKRGWGEWWSMKKNMKKQHKYNDYMDSMSTEYHRQTLPIESVYINDLIFCFNLCACLCFSSQYQVTTLCLEGASVLLKICISWFPYISAEGNTYHNSARTETKIIHHQAFQGTNIVSGIGKIKHAWKIRTAGRAIFLPGRKSYLYTYKPWACDK